ncbi:aminopeptidase, partial [Intestinibacter bartlettii]
SSCIEGGNDIKAEDFDKYGINDSLTHVDFMVGSADLDIVGITHDGEEIQIFKDGNWAF